MNHGFPQGLDPKFLTQLFAAQNLQNLPNLANLQQFQNLHNFAMPKEGEENNENYEPQPKLAKLEDDSSDSGIAHTPSPHNLSDEGEIAPLQIAEEEEGVEMEDDEQKPPLSPVSNVSNPAENNDEGEAPPELMVAPFASIPDTLSYLPGTRVYNQIVKDAYFRSYKDFYDVFKNWMDTNYHPFRVASSEKMVDTPHADTFQYRYIVYHCKHYGMPRKRGQGKRPNQCYMPCGCKAMLRLNYQSNERMLRLTTIVEEHNGHEVSKEAYEKALTNNRRSIATPRGSPLRMAHSPNHLLNSPQMMNFNGVFNQQPQVPSFNAHNYQQQSIAALILMHQQNQQQQQQHFQQKLLQDMAYEGLVAQQQSPQEESAPAVEVKTEQVDQEQPASLPAPPQNPQFAESPALARPTPTRPQNQNPLLPLNNITANLNIALCAEVLRQYNIEKDRRMNDTINRLKTYLQTLNDPQVFCAILTQLEALLPKN